MDTPEPWTGGGSRALVTTRLFVQPHELCLPMPSQRYGFSLFGLIFVLGLAGCGDNGPAAVVDRPQQLSQVVSAADSVTLSGPVGDYLVIRNGDTVRIVHRTGVDAPLQVAHTTVAHFADVSLSFDVAGTAGQTYRLYQAAFARVPDLDGLGFWSHAAKSGYSMDAVAAEFEKSAEYLRLYGGAPENADVVKKYYTNVLGRAPDEAGAAYWVNSLVSGAVTRVQVLRAFAESDENKARTLPSVGYGIPFKSPDRTYQRSYEAQAPVAYPGSSRTAAVGAPIVLAGDQSVSRTGNPLAFEWTFISKPSNSAAALTQNGATVSFTPDVPGVYTVALTVTDGQRRSAGAGVDITAGAGNPIGDALSVVVAAGSRVGGAKVVLRDANGRTTSAVANAQGEAVLNVAGLSPPYLLMSSVNSQEGAATAGLTLYGYYLNGEQRANLTPVTTAVVASLTGNRNAAAFDLFVNETTAKALLSDARVLAAEQSILADGEKRGVPRSLLLNPNAAAALVPVALPPAMAGTNLLGFLAEGVKTVIDNAIRFGCDGTAYGTMEDGSRRPSCLEGGNWPLAGGAKLAAKQVARPSDPTIRADELVGLNAPGGGWKFRGERVPAEQRAIKVGEKVFSMIKALDTFAVLNDRAIDASAVTFLKSVNWSSFCQRLTDEVRVSELSDVFHGYRLIKLTLENKANETTATWRIGAYPPDAVDRVLPVFGPDNGDPTIGKLKQVCMDGASQLASELSAGGNAEVPYDLSKETVGSLATSYVAAVEQLALVSWRDPEWDIRTALVAEVSLKAMICKIDLFTFEEFMLLNSVNKESFPPEARAALERVRSRTGSTAKCDVIGGVQSGVDTARRLGKSIAERLITAYENEFSVHFVGAQPPSLSAYAIRATPGHLLSNVEYDVIIPDMAATGVSVQGNSLLQLPMQWKYVERPNPVDEIVINPELRAAYLGCATTDKPCLAQLARTRKYKTLYPVVSVTGPLRTFDSIYLLSMQANLVSVEEALTVMEFPFLRPGQ